MKANVVNVKMPKCGVAYLGCNFDKKWGNNPSFAPANITRGKTRTIEFKQPTIAAIAQPSITVKPQEPKSSWAVAAIGAF